ncbi:MAG: hypothetical protein QXK89_10905 [Candidatus Bathyarchaeia archaeon]
MPLDERERYDSIYSTIPYIKKVHKSLEDTCIGAAQKALEFGMEWIKKFFLQNLTWVPKGRRT